MTVCLGLLLLAAQGANPMARGLDLFRQERFEAALAEFQRVARTQPPNATVENVLGITLTKLGRISEAERHYRNSIRLNPQFAAPHKNLGFNHLSGGRYAAAEEELKAAARLDGGDPFVELYLGMVYLATGRDAEAIAALEREPALLANDGNTSAGLARAYLRAGQASKAAAVLEPVRMSLSDESCWQLAQSFLSLRAADEAIPLLEQVRAHRPRDANVLALLGSALEAASRTSDALEAYRQAAVADPENPDRYLDYSRLLLDLDRYTESLQFISDALPRVKDSYALQIRLGTVHMMSGRYDEARAAFQSAIRQHPEVTVGYIAVARTWFKQGQGEEGVKVLEDAQKKALPDFALKYFYGVALARVQRQDEAITVLQDAAKLPGAVAAVHYELGKLFLATDRDEQALREFELVIGLEPANPNPYYQLSQLYNRRGDEAKARQMAARTRELKQAQLERNLEAQRRRHEVLVPGPAR